MQTSHSVSYAAMILSDRAQNTQNLQMLLQKQSALEEVVFDYSKESSYSVKDQAGQDIQISRHVMFEASRCDLVGRDAPPCKACVDSCEFSALFVDTLAKSITLGHQNCTACGKCIGACPTGAMQSAKFNFESIVAILEETKGFGLLVAKESDLKELKTNIPHDTLILCVDNYSMFSEVYLSVMALKTGGRLFFVGESLLPGDAVKSITIANALISTLYGLDGIKYLNSDADVSKAFERVGYRVENISFRAAFAECIKATGKLGDSTFQTESSMLAYVSVDERCTACMGCAFVCKSSAFVASQEQGALLLNSSLCTACGYCEVICPEKSIKITKNRLSLKPEDFTHKEAARDELFYCVECGKPFATKKSIEKVAGVFAQLFMEESKKRTLYCCAECKPKIMMQEMINQNAGVIA